MARIFLQGPHRLLYRVCFRPRISGWEHVPAEGPFLLVANHSGGGGVEVFALAMLWLERFGSWRPITGLAHPIAFYVPGAAAIIRGLGAVPSTYEAGLRALRAGLPLIVFPGGDYEAMRPVWQASRVDFNGRRGFLRLGREAWVPVVPLGIRGSALAAPCLWRSRWILPYLLVFPRLIGLKRFPLTLTGLLGALAIGFGAGPSLGPLWTVLAIWVWLLSPFAIQLPLLPWTVSARFGPPIPPAELFGPRDAERPLGEAYEQIVAEVQQLVREP